MKMAKQRKPVGMLWEMQDSRVRTETWASFAEVSGSSRADTLPIEVEALILWVPSAKGGYETKDVRPAARPFGFRGK